MTTDSRSGYLDIFMVLLILTVVFAFGVVVGVGLSWLMVKWWVR